MNNNSSTTGYTGYFANMARNAVNGAVQWAVGSASNGVAAISRQNQDDQGNNSRQVQVVRQPRPRLTLNADAVDFQAGSIFSILPREIFRYIITFCGLEKGATRCALRSVCKAAYLLERETAEMTVEMKMTMKKVEKKQLKSMSKEERIAYSKKKITENMVYAKDCDMLCRNVDYYISNIDVILQCMEEIIKEKKTLKAFGASLDDRQEFMNLHKLHDAFFGHSLFFCLRHIRSKGDSTNVLPKFKRMVSLLVEYHNLGATKKSNFRDTASELFGNVTLGIDEDNGGRDALVNFFVNC